MRSIVFKTSLILATAMVILMFIVGIYINNKQKTILNELQQHQKNYIISHLDQTAKISIEKNRQYLQTILDSISGGLGEALYNMNDDMITIILKKLLKSVKSIKGAYILDINTQESYIAAFKNKEKVVFTTKLPKNILNISTMYKVKLNYQDESLGELIVYFDDTIVKKDIELLKQQDLKKFTQYVDKVNQKIKDELIKQIIVFIISLLFIVGLIVILLYIFVKKPLNSFQKGLNSFFYFLENPKVKVHTIDINTTDEFGQMSKSVNHSIAVSIALHKELKNSKSKLQLLNKSLENKIANRTKELEHQKQYFEVFFKNEGVGILIVDRNRTNIKVNPKLCKMWGYNESEIIGKNAELFHVSHETYLEFGRIAFEQVQNGKHIDIAYQFKKKNGQLFWARFYGEFITDGQVLWVIEDITIQKEYQITLESSKKHIEKIHKNIKDSIQFASLIQQAILPQEEILEYYTKEHFTIWQPKDVVGGDIYFVAQLDNKKEVIIMVIDGAGHGVPGAFVTMLVKAVEKQIHAELNIGTLEPSPAKILEYFNKSIKTMLNQEKGNRSKSNAGFDGGIIYFNKETKECKYSGAKIDLFIVNNNQIETIKGDRKNVGFVRTKMTQKYTDHLVELQEETKLYLATDGIIDQQNKEKQRYSTKRLKELFVSVSNYPLKKQQDIIKQEINEFMEDVEQIDDITIVGLKF